MSISKRVVAIIISLSVLFLTLATTGIFVVVNEINKTNSNATTTGTSSLANIYNTDGTINAVAAYEVLKAVGYIGHENDTGTYTAHNIAGRMSDGSGATVIFPMGYYVSKSGTMDTSKPIYWQAVYLRNGYLTIWMNNNYTADYFNKSSSTASGWGNGASYTNYSNYSKSTLRDITNNIYTALSGELTNFSTFVKSPSQAGATWQATQTEDIYAYRNIASSTDNSYKDSYYRYAHHNGLDSYSGKYTDWSNDLWNTSDTPYNDEFWIPSYYEVYNTSDHATTSSEWISSQDSLWGLTAADRGFKSINNDRYTIEGSGSTNNCWLRSGYSYDSGGAMQVNYSGSANYSNVVFSYGVRPACHLSLTALKNAAASIGNMLSNDGTTINTDTYQALLSALGSYGSTARTAADIRSANSGNPVIFQMGEVLNTTTNKTVPIYWQVVYQVGDIITVWMTDCYTTERYNTTSSSYTVSSNNLTLLQTYIDSSYPSYNKYPIYSNYSKSVLRDLTNAIYLKLAEDNSVLNEVVKSPSAAGATWQKTQTEDIYCFYNNIPNASDNKDDYYIYAHHNGLDSYSGLYTKWSNDLWNTSDTPYNDEFWIPSYYEVYNASDHQTSTVAWISSQDSYWGLNDSDRVFATTTRAGSSESYCWLRSGISEDSSSAIRLMYSGSALGNGVGGSHGVRPACHLSLSAMQATFGDTVTLDQQGGSGGTASVTVASGSAMPSITAPTRTGYTFGGYYTGTNGTGTQYYTSSGTSARNWDLEGDQTLYAKWTVNTYYIAYNGNNATSGSMSNSTHTYGTAKALTTNAYIRLGYAFKGWDTSSAGTNVVYQDGASILNLRETNGETVNLYAVWELEYYTINVVSINTDYGTILNTGDTFTYGNTYTTYAIAKPNCAFLYWIDSTNPTEPIFVNPLTITATATKTYTAYFTDSVIEGVACVAGNGGEARMVGYTADDTGVTFIAVAYAGYQFDGWFIQGETTALNTNLSCILDMSIIDGKIIVARFSKIDTSNSNTETDNDKNNEFL